MFNYFIINKYGYKKCEEHFLVVLIFIYNLVTYILYINAANTAASQVAVSRVKYK